MGKMIHKFGTEYTSEEIQVKHALLDNISNSRQKEIESYPYILKAVILDIIDELGESKLSKKNVSSIYKKLQKNSSSSAYDIFEHAKNNPPVISIKETQKEVPKKTEKTKIIRHPATGTTG